mmetsp:Transcript_35522/g.76808  ORF Transcript_35522/g.76808 Transcript_35522/m.76808 type:complete len:221 (-) Transcript_35522:756-1418(-)
MVLSFRLMKSRSEVSFLSKLFSPLRALDSTPMRNSISSSSVSIFLVTLAISPFKRSRSCESPSTLSCTCSACVWTSCITSCTRRLLKSKLTADSSFFLIFSSSSSRSPDTSRTAFLHSWTRACSARRRSSTPSMSDCRDNSLDSLSSSRLFLCATSASSALASSSTRDLTLARSTSSLSLSSSSSNRPNVSTSSFSVTICTSRSSLCKYLRKCVTIFSAV